MLVAGMFPSTSYVGGVSSSDPEQSSEEEQPSAPCQRPHQGREVDSLERELEEIIEHPTRKRKRASDSIYTGGSTYDASQHTLPSTHTSRTPSSSMDVLMDPLGTRNSFGLSSNLSSSDITEILTQIGEQLESTASQNPTNQLLDQTDDNSSKAFACEECSRGFARRSDLLRHKRIHTGEKPHLCSHPGCSKAFIQRSALTVHKRTHTGERPHICEYPDCGKAFGDSSSLARHRRTHTGRRPFECPEESCEKTFTRKATLMHHLRSHGPEWDIPVPSLTSLEQRNESSKGEQTTNSPVDKADPNHDPAALPVAAPPMATYLFHNKSPINTSHPKAPDIDTGDISASVAAAIAHANARAALDQKQGSDDSSGGEEELNGEDVQMIVAGSGPGAREYGEDASNAELDAWVNSGMVDDTPAG